MSIKPSKRNVREDGQVRTTYTYQLSRDNGIIEVLRRKHTKGHTVVDGNNMLSLPPRVGPDFFDDAISPLDIIL